MIVLGTAVWKSMAEAISVEVNAPIMTEGCSWGKLPFFQEIRQKKGEFCSPLPGVKYVSVPYGDSSIFVGPYKTEGFKSDDEDLLDSWKNLPMWNNSKEAQIVTSVKVALSAASQASKGNNELSRLSLMLELSHSAGHLRDVEQVLSVSAHFIVRKFKVGNVVIEAFGKRVPYFDTDKATSIALQRLGQHASESRTTLLIKNTKTDMLLEDMKEDLPKSISVFPLLEDGKSIGNVFVLNETIPGKTEWITDVLREMTLILTRVIEYERVQESAKTDVLTGLHNRAELRSSLDKLLPKLASSNSPISLLLFDVDDFKKFNDAEGHPAGDRVLKKIAELTKSTMPASAICCRYGGEEFIVVLPNTDQLAAKDEAEKLLRTIEQNSALTISIGLMTCLNSSASRELLIQEADKALYKAKRLGKNCVVPFVMVDKNLGVIDTQI